MLEECEYLLPAVPIVKQSENVNSGAKLDFAHIRWRGSAIAVDIDRRGRTIKLQMTASRAHGTLMQSSRAWPRKVPAVFQHSLPHSKTLMVHTIRCSCDRASNTAERRR